MPETGKGSLLERYRFAIALEYTIWFVGSAVVMLALPSFGLAVFGLGWAVVMLVVLVAGIRAWRIAGEFMRDAVERRAPFREIGAQLAWKSIVVFMPAFYLVLAGGGYLPIGLIFSVPPITWRVFTVLRLRARTPDLFPIG